MKVRRDRLRARKAIRQDPNLLPSMLAESFHEDGRLKMPITKIVERLDRKRRFLGTSLLKKLIGQGYLRPDGNGYQLTKSGLAYRSGAHPVVNRLAPAKRLQRIADIIEDIETRCMAADGPVTNTRQEMMDEELREIYRLARRQPVRA